MCSICASLPTEFTWISCSGAAGCSTDLALPAGAAALDAGAAVWGCRPQPASARRPAAMVSVSILQVRICSPFNPPELEHLIARSLKVKGLLNCMI
jgi:hypothetical protein